MYYSTIRQLTKAIVNDLHSDSFFTPTLNPSTINLYEDVVTNVIVLARANTKEEYLEWVAVWKKINKELVSYIKEIKSHRSDVDYWNDIVNKHREFNQYEPHEYMPSVETAICRARDLARVLYNIRTVMKDHSYCNKLSREITDIEVDLSRLVA